MKWPSRWFAAEPELRQTRRHLAAVRPQAVRLRVEALEDRRVLAGATMLPMSLSAASGSLDAQAAATIVRFIDGATNQPHTFVGGDYTDLGLVGSGNRTFDANDSLADLKRVQALGVTHERIWATDLPEGGAINSDLTAAASRVHTIASQAASLGMDVTVDLWNPGLGVANYQARDAYFNSLVSVIVGNNAGASNILWSLGNEIGDINNPAGFVSWYQQKAQLIRQTGGAGTKIIGELLPGSVNHPWASPVYAAAAQQIVALSDVVSQHFYPTETPNATYLAGDWEWKSILLWSQYAASAGKPFILGEFGINETIRTTTLVQQWLQHFFDMGVQHVDIWQFMKDGVGHLDPYSFDVTISGHDYSASLQSAGWLGKAPPGPIPPWQYQANPFDVNSDGKVEAIDALMVINELNRAGSRPLSAPPAGSSAPPPYYDVSGDNRLSPLDALGVINYLNSQSALSSLNAVKGLSAAEQSNVAFSLTIEQTESLRATRRLMQADDPSPMGLEMSSPQLRRRRPH